MQQFRDGVNSSIMLKKWGEIEGEVGENIFMMQPLKSFAP